MPQWVIDKVTPDGYESKLAFARLNTENLDTGFRIHSDGKTADNNGKMFQPEYAAVFYPFDTPGHGTALFTHKLIGDRSKPLQGKAFKIDDGMWSVSEWYEGKENTAFYYEANRYHCRYPFKSFGSTIKDGRIIIVNFMVRKK